MENPIIQLNGLSKHYGSKKAVENLSLKINKGEIFGLLGPNGAGKTTTILMMLGLSEPTSGEALVCGINATNNPIAVKRKVGYMPDNVGFYDNMTALENLMYIGRLSGIPEEKIAVKARETMELVGLGDELYKKTGAYSRGMKQRLALADLLIREPEVMILDEPTLGIDPAGIKEFLVLIRQLSRQQGLTVLLSSHHLHQMQQICDRVGIFVEGQLLMEGNIDTLSGNLFGKESYVIQVTVREPLANAQALQQELQQLEYVNKAATSEYGVELSCSQDITPDIVRFFVHKGLNVTGVQKKEYGLDEIYQRFFENNAKKHVQ
ncbi:ABC-2 type transport system ATP-binding protein [Chitinophaga terrae (ex Kim and Jung 2007)]|uniref:ABC transporter ATP-binding protein n=1 Tax=Chitinophaga terrae (ex Kim and Jung 2007) TaxID=408074 RepID=UPI00277D4E6F|nr:ABC transporter ATP-binding protein [Chitinophaga terrae (ex Kim and Jung 2007)]MDQ0108417.1 ABC-2 type transport system ATP-binding protein [Chitinophaga terrae (ex Kim and Jung 2007)]